MPPPVLPAPRRPARGRDLGLPGGRGRHRRQAMRRGDLVTVALPGGYDKPQPALVVQSDPFDEHPSVTILPITGELRVTPLFRIDVRSSVAKGLGKLRPRACRATGSATPSADGGMILVVGQPGYWPCFSGLPEEVFGVLGRLGFRKWG